MKACGIAIVLTAAALAGGCVEREMVITSDPAGALVIISDVEKGRTPLKVDFQWYGDYEFILRRDGYETLITHRQINAPAYEIPPADLFSALAPWTYHDTRYLHFQMRKLTPPADDALISRADNLRRRNLQPVPR